MTTSTTTSPGSAASSKSARRLRIGLLWHSANSGNLGVGALTVANLAIARAIAAEQGIDAQFVILGMRDGDTPPVVGPEVDVRVIDMRTMLSPSGFWRTAGELDCVLDIGAGDSFAEIYGAKRFGFLVATKLMTSARGVPLVLAPQTIGPFRSAGYKWLAGLAMTRAAAVVARDVPSYEAAAALAPRARVLQSADVAFVLPFSDRSGERGGTRPRVGLNVSGLLFTDAQSGRNRFGMDLNYADLTRRLIQEFQARDAEIHLIAHVASPRMPEDDDGVIAERLAAEFPGTVRVADFPGPSEAKSYISSLDFLVAGRMHACIGAFSSGTPVVPIAYSRKFAGVFGMVDYPWLVPVTGMNTDAAVAYVMDAFARRDRLASDERRGMAKVDALLDAYRDELRRTFARAVERRRRG